MHYDPRNANCIVFFAIMSTTHNLYAMECTPLIAYPYTTSPPRPQDELVICSWDHYTNMLYLQSNIILCHCGNFCNNSSYE